MPLPPAFRNMYFALYMAFLSAPDYTQLVTGKPGIIPHREMTAFATPEPNKASPAFTDDHCPRANLSLLMHRKRCHRFKDARELLQPRT